MRASPGFVYGRLRELCSSVHGNDGSHDSRLHPPPCVFSILAIHAECQPHTAHLGSDDRPPGRCGEPRIRHHRLLGCRQSTQHAGGELPEGARHPGQPCGLLHEQIFLVNTVNALERTDEWKDTAIIILYDDSDGWYDHVMGPIVNRSNVTDDQLLEAGNCGAPKAIDAKGTIQNGR